MSWPAYIASVTGSEQIFQEGKGEAERAGPLAKCAKLGGLAPSHDAVAVGRVVPGQGTKQSGGENTCHHHGTDPDRSLPVCFVIRPRQPRKSPSKSVQVWFATKKTASTLGTKKPATIHHADPRSDPQPTMHRTSA